VRREITGGAVGLDLLATVFHWGIRIGAVVIVLITGYYVYGVMGAGDQLFRGLVNGQAMPPQEFQRHLANMELLTKVLLLASLVLVISAIGRYPGHPETGALILFVGALFFFGMPFLIQNFGGQGALDRRLARMGDPKAFLEGRYQLAGLIMLASGAVFLLVHGFLTVVNMKGRRPQANAEAMKTAQQVRKPNDRFLGPCWMLPFCRDTDKKLCPVRASKKPCWRTGRGCYCDQNIILSISGGNAYQASRGGAGYLSRSAATVQRPKTLREKREQCLQCPVYLHHQGQKYKLITPLAVAAAVGALVMYWSQVIDFYPQAMQAMGRALSGFSFGPSSNGVPAWAQDLATNQGMMWVLFGVAALLLLSYLLHSLEWILYRLGV
jgi:hypothetical protein